MCCQEIFYKMKWGVITEGTTSKEVFVNEIYVINDFYRVI